MPDPKMVRHTLKILQHLQQDCQSVSDHFTTLRSKWLKLEANSVHVMNCITKN